MPRAPKRCARRGCHVRVVARTYCDEHRPIGWEKNSNPRTGSAAHRAWRDAVLARAGHPCEIRGPRCTNYAVAADHVTAVAEGGPEFDIMNGQAACGPCHQAKTQAEAARGLRRALGRS